MKSTNLARLTPTGGVHGTKRVVVNQRQWRDKPLLKFEGQERYFKTGTEAVQIITDEAKRRDGDKKLYLEQFEAMMQSLTPVFDRAPRYAWLAKAFLEPERSIEFRVSFLDDSGSVRTHRGYRIQYSSTLGPYEGPLHFGVDVTSDKLKSCALGTCFANALNGSKLGGAAGGANFDPQRSSESEIQRFCQSYMSELSKYIGPSTDLPSIGQAVGRAEVGYLYGHFKRVSNLYSPHGSGLLWGGALPHPEAYGYSVVHFAKHALEERGETIEGKRCAITGSGKIALAVAERLIALGAIPLTFSDQSGHVYEPDGITEAKFQKVNAIKQERGARIGRYIIASTTAKYNDRKNIFDTPSVDIVFAAATSSEIDVAEAHKIADSGCKMVVDAAHAPTTPAAARVLKKLGVLHAPYKATLAAGVLLDNAEDITKTIDDITAKVYFDVSKTAIDYNARGDLNAGTNISSFLKIANLMDAHGAI
ncbi:hypothetical protein CTAYLR_000512 [Chrysophaeum taylorii]|uniref:glutamate dehydrogenase (NADP(+)) n=1 Tax=Chrysophaeum taylorii TaxID=2483200 RepID=A0AAD7UHH9_9STRA|nr:hypothetical protein CTAYLR_000512 [Chrysophaeum taylorii]